MTPTATIFVPALRDDPINGLIDAALLNELVAFGAAITGSRPEGEDLASDAICRAMSRLRSGGVEDPRRYLFRCMTNLARSRWRAVTRASRVRRLDRPGRLPDPVESIVAADEVMRALLLLPTRQRIVVVCRYLLDLSEADTAATMGIAAGTVKSQLARAMRTLQEHAKGDRGE